jgi:hypothetical protein
VAHQQARYLIRALPQAQALRGRAVGDFVYRDFGALVPHRGNAE